MENGMTLDIPEGTVLTVPEGKTFTNNGTINVVGTIVRDGTIICNSHIGGTATCTAKAVCDVCLAEYGEINADNHTGEKVWSTDEKTHSQKWDCCGTVTVAEENHEWKDGKCEECGYACAHKGGEATCTAKPVCEICGSEYGEINTVNHAGLKHFEGTPATTEREGNIEYWFCEDCVSILPTKTAQRR